MWLRAATCIGINCLEQKCGHLCRCAGIPVLGLRVRGLGFTVQIMPIAHAHLETDATCTCTFGRGCLRRTHTWARMPIHRDFQLLSFRLGKKGIVASIWEYIGKYSSQLFGTCTFPTHGPDKQGGQKPKGCAECSPLLAANASRHKLPFRSEPLAAQSIACICKYC